MPLLFPLLVSISCVASPNNGTFQEKMQAKLEELFLGPNGFFNKSVPPKTGAPPGGFWFAFRNATDAITVSLGVSDGKSVSDGGTAAVATDIIPAGSLTKPFTAAAVMRLVETGVVRLEDPVAMHIDPFLTRINGSNTTMEAVWGPMVRNVTIRMLLNMRSGMPDYNNQVIQRDTLWSPDWDIGPQDYLSLVGYSKEKWRFAPGTRSEYCSMGYLMLALVQANHAKQADGSPLTDWAQLDQKAAAIPAHLLEGFGYNSTTFFTRGHCSAYSNVAHYYYLGNKSDPAYVDMYERSCLNGWGFGNLGISAQDAASFFYDLLGPQPKIVSGRARLLMQQFTGWGTKTDYVGDGHHYGFGVWEDPYLTLHGPFNTSVPGTVATFEHV
jgi:CubicO group peptidase (beta-lactamase class C family)